MLQMLEITTRIMTEEVDMKGNWEIDSLPEPALMPPIHRGKGERKARGDVWVSMTRQNSRDRKREWERTEQNRLKLPDNKKIDAPW